jgi:hypothetical protein
VSGWLVTGVDVSEDQIRPPRARGVDVVRSFALERFEDPGGREYPYLVALRRRR